MAALVLASSSRQSAHDFPADVTVQLFLKPEGQRLRLLVRVPLGAMQDFVFPQRGPGYLDVEAADSMLRNAVRLWVGDELEVYEEGSLLTGQRLAAIQVSLPGDLSFATYDEALAHVTGPPLPDGTALYGQQAMLDALFEYTIRSDQSDFSIEPTLARLGLRTITVLRFVLPGGTVRAFEYAGNPGRVRLDPRWHQAALRFVALGFEHILDGVDHLLFLACLIIPFRRLRPLIAIVTAFTVAHSVTLIASAFNLAPDALWFPPLIETAIAASILFMAIENIVGINLRRRWLITFAFGLVHGFGFSFALRQTLQFAGSHLLTSLLSFNIRGRTRPAARPRAPRPRARPAVPIRDCRVDRHDHPVGAGGPHRLALDDGPRGAAGPVPDSAAGAHLRPAVSGQRHAMGHAGPDHRGPGLAPVHRLSTVADRKRRTIAGDDGAIRRLEAPGMLASRGNIAATGTAEAGNSSR